VSDYDVDRIEKPKYFRVGPLTTGRSQRKTQVIGFDSEADTRTGRPMLLQFSATGDENDVMMPIVDERKRGHARALFLAYIGKFCTRKDTEYIIYGWNLAYEFTQLFGDLDEDARVVGELELTTDVIDPDGGESWSFRLRIVNDTRYMATITNLSTHRMIRFLDGMAFYKTGLDAAARMLKLGEKYALPAGGLDRTTFTRLDLDDPIFLAYAARDAYITRMVGEHIVSQFEAFDVPTCVSAPHFAARVFRHRFLDAVVAPPDRDLEQAGLWSYHGGKNGHYHAGPADFPNVHQYDITSAYPEAMSQLPDITQAVWHPVDDYQPGRHAIYCVTLLYRCCTYRGFMAHDGTWPNDGIVKEVYITGYELDAMMERGECDILAIMGWMMVGPSGGPLARYVETFFDLKRRSTGPERETAKLFLNSLYGKFFQKVALGRVGTLDMDTLDWVVTDPTQDFDHRAGGLYHPPIASLITGFVRARIHRLEHRYGSLMTSTDGIFALQAPDASDLGEMLGDLTHQAGSLRLWKERLYIFRPHDGSKPKWAAHSFRGTLDQLDALPTAPGVYDYEAKQLVTLKLSTADLHGNRYDPGRFVTLPFQLNIPY